MTPATAIAPTTRPATRIRAANGVGSSAPTTTYPTSRARVPIMVTGSPDNIWQATSTVSSAKLRTDRARRSRSTAQSNQGIHATDHDKFGKLLVEITAPLPANTTAPSVALAGNRYQREAHHGGKQDAEEKDRRQEKLIERVRKRGLASRGVRIPPWPCAGQKGASDPNVARPEEHRQVADVEDFREAQALREWHTGDQNCQRWPRPGPPFHYRHASLFGTTGDFPHL